MTNLKEYLLSYNFEQYSFSYDYIRSRPPDCICKLKEGLICIKCQTICNKIKKEEQEKNTTVNIKTHIKKEYKEK